MRMPKRTSQRTFLEEVFIRNVESFWWTLPTLIYPMSLTVGVGSHCVTSESLCDVLITCPSMLIQEFYSNMHGFDYLVPLFSTHVRGTHIVVTPQLVVDVLQVPRVEHPDYLRCERLRTVSKDEMISAFCERPSDWGDRQFTPCKTFAKGPRFINMAMTFVLHPLSHYNSITEPRA